MIYPDHYDRGWHITGSTGMLGAAAACARLLALDVEQTTMALGIAASQPIGVREQFGSMTKPFHPGGAARAGLTSALMAKHGFTASARAHRGAARHRADVLRRSARGTRSPTSSASASRSRSTPTSRSRAASSSIPSIDGCVQLRNAHGLRAGGHRAHRPARASAGAGAHRQDGAAHRPRRQVQRLPRVRGRHHLRPGGRSRILGRGRRARRRGRAARARPAQSSTSASTRRRRTSRSRLNDGRTHHVFVEHAIGSLERPMSDDDLARKFHGLVDPVLGAARADELIAAAMDVAPGARSTCLQLRRSPFCVMRQLRMKASRSGLMTSACVVHMPCGSPRRS